MSTRRKNDTGRGRSKESKEHPEEQIDVELVLSMLEEEKKTKKYPAFPPCKKSDLIKPPPLVPPENPIEVLPWSDYIEANKEAKQEFYDHALASYKRILGPKKGKKTWEAVSPIYLDEPPIDKKLEKAEERVEVGQGEPTYCPKCREKWEPGLSMVQCDDCDQCVCGLIFDMPKDADPWCCPPCLKKRIQFCS